MENILKRTISVFLTMVFLTALVLISKPLSKTVKADTVPMGMKILRDYSGYAVGTNAAGGTNVNPGGSGETAVISQTVGGIGAVNSLTLSAAGELVGLVSNYEIKYPDYPNISELDGVMLYVKLPRDGEQAFSRFFFNFVVEAGGSMRYIHWGSWSQGNRNVSYLGSASSKWENTTTDDGGNITLPYGFEGYVRFLFADLNQATRDALALSDSKAIESTVKFRMVGGKYGVGKVGAVYGITQNSDSAFASLNGAQTVGLNTGKLLDADNQIFLDASMKGFVMQDFNAFEVGDNINSSRIFASTANSSGFAAAAAGNVGGIGNTPALKLSANEAKGWFNGADFYHEVFFPDGMKMDDMKAMLFYVKLAAPVQEETESKIYFGIYSNGTEGQRWTNLGGGKALYMEKGGNKWFSVNAAEGILSLPGSFEGYIMADISDFRTNPVADILTDRTAISVTFRFHSIGGTDGDCYIQSMYGITDMGTENTFFTLNGQDVYSLKRSALAIPEDFKAKPPEIGEEFSNLPVPTTEKTIYDPDLSYIDADSARVAWENMDGADMYRVDVFSFNTMTERYICASTEETDESRVILVDLNEDTTYYVVVNAMDRNEQIAGIYDAKRFRTGTAEDDFNWDDDLEEEYSWEDEDGSGGGGDNGTTSGNDVTDSPTTSDNSELMTVIALICAAAVLLFSRESIIARFKKKEGESS